MFHSVSEQQQRKGQSANRMRRKTSLQSPPFNTSRGSCILQSNFYFTFFPCTLIGYLGNYIFMEPWCLPCKSSSLFAFRIPSSWISTFSCGIHIRDHISLLSFPVCYDRSFTTHGLVGSMDFLQRSAQVRDSLQKAHGISNWSSIAV